MNLMKKLKVYSGFSKSIYILFIARIVNSMGNFVFPFLTLFLTERLGLSPTEAGVYFMMSALAQAVGSIIGGKLTDRLGRKKLFLSFQVLAILCFIPCVFLGNSLLIPKFIILYGMFSGASQTVNSAIIIDLTDKDNRKQVYSFLYFGTNIGFSIGPMIAGFLYENHTNWIFLGNIISLIIVTIMVALFIEETKPSDKDIEDSKNIEDEEAAESGSVFSALIKRPKLLLFLFGKLLNTFIYSTIGFAIPIQLANMFGDGLGSKYFGVLMSLNALVVVAGTIAITKVTMKLKAVVAVAIASMLYAIGFGMLGFANAFWIYIISAIIYTIGEIIEATNSGVYIANNSPMSHRGRFNTVVTIISGAGFAVGPYLFGGFIERFGLFNLWMMCFGIGVIASGFMYWLNRWDSRSS